MPRPTVGGNLARRFRHSPHGGGSRTDARDHVSGCGALPFGAQWTANGGALSRSAPNSSLQLGNQIDSAVASALATMLGGVSVVKASQKKRTQLHPPDPDCVETAPVTVVGGIRKQNYDVVYRPDGATRSTAASRAASKTL